MDTDDLKDKLEAGKEKAESFVKDTFNKENLEAGKEKAKAGAEMVNEKIKGLAFRGMLEKKIPAETRAKFPVLDKIIPLTNYIALGVAALLVIVIISSIGGGGNREARQASSGGTTATAQGSGGASTAQAGGQTSAPAAAAPARGRGAAARVNAGTVAPPVTDLGDFKTDGFHSISGYDGFDRDLDIPAQIGSRTTRFITPGSLRDYALTSVNIPAGIRVLAYAFQNNRLTSLTIPPRAIVGSRAFAENQITDLIIGDGVILTGGVFQSARGNNPLTSITVGNGVHIMDYALRGDTYRNPGNISIGNGGSMNVYDFNSFLRGGTNMQRQITLGDKIGFDKSSSIDHGYYTTYFDYMANDRRAGTYEIPAQGQNFYPTQNEGDFQFLETPYGVVIIGIGAGRAVNIPGELGGLPVKGIFSGGRNVNRVQLPESLTFIDTEAFDGADLSEITIPSGVTLIGASAFLRNQLNSVAIPAAVTLIGTEAFRFNQNGGIRTLTIPNNSSLEYIGASAFRENNISTPLVLLAGLTYLGDNAFANNNIPSVTLPVGLTYMGDNVFENNNLTSITLPNDLYYIGPRVFAGNNLSTVTLPSGIEFIGEGAFSQNNITDLTIPPSLIYTGSIRPTGYTGTGGGFELGQAFGHSSFYYTGDTHPDIGFSARDPLEQVTTLNLPANLPDSALGFPRVVVQLYIQNERRAATFEYRAHPVRTTSHPLGPFIDDTYRPDSGWQLVQ